MVIVKLENVTACIYAPHSGPPNIIYAPMWMCESLGVSVDPPEDDDDDLIVMERVHPPICTFVQVQPHTLDHLPAIAGGFGNEMPEDTLSRAFEEYTCIEQGQTMMLHLPNNNRMFVTIVETQPSQGSLCIRNTEVAMDLLPAPVASDASDASNASDAPVELETVACTETREERRERMYKAALDRLQKSTS